MECPEHGKPMERIDGRWTDGDGRPLPPMTPLPFHQGTSNYGLQPMFLNNMALDDPGTPPYTPPRQYSLPCQPPPFVDDTNCFRKKPESLDGPPMDSSMADAGGGWEQPDCTLQSSDSESSAASPGVSSNNNNSGSSPRGKEFAFSDYKLVTLSVRELNRQIRGCSAEEKVFFKAKRRLLKNKQYAKNCRSRRLEHAINLEIANRRLLEELRQTKIDLARVTAERDMYIFGPGFQMQNYQCFNNQTTTDFNL